MSTFLATTDVRNLQAAANYLLLAQAYESPSHPDFIQRLEAVAVSTGFASAGRFRESMKLRPFSTLTLFLAYLGGNTASQANTQSAPVLPSP